VCCRMGLGNAIRVSCEQSGGDVVLVVSPPKTCFWRIRCSARLTGFRRMGVSLSLRGANTPSRRLTCDVLSQPMLACRTRAHYHRGPRVSPKGTREDYRGSMNSQYKDHVRCGPTRRELRTVSTARAGRVRQSPHSRSTTYPVMAMISPWWSRPYGFRVCSIFDRMSRYDAACGRGERGISRLGNVRRDAVWVPETLSTHATWAYSWIRPPSRSRRRIRTFAPGTGGCSRPAGGLW
jgi:hypothetical protein